MKEKKFTLHAVDTATNVSDIGTKALARERFEELRMMLGVIDNKKKTIAPGRSW